MDDKFLKEVLEKFAVSGAMYSRALGNAAQRNGGRIAPKVLGQVAAQPRATSMPGLAETARAPGARAPSPELQGLQHMMEAVPFAGSEYHHDAGARQSFPGEPGVMVPAQHAAVDKYHEQLRQTGRSQNIKTPGFERQLREQFGVPAGHPTWAAYDKTQQLGRQQDRQQQNVFQKQMLLDPALLKQLPEHAGSARAYANPSPFEPTQRALLSEKTTPGSAMARRKTAVDWGSVARSAAPYAIGAGIPLAAAGGIMLSKPGVQSSIKEKLQHGNENTASKDTAAPIPDEMHGVAARAHEALLARGLDPATQRIAVDAPPGSGKSVLSRALVHRMGVKHYGLDWLPEEQRDFSGGHMERMPRPPRAGEVTEHHNLLRTHDPELFDSAIYIAKDPETIKKQIIGRGRSAGLADFYNYKKTIGVGHLAFDSLDGEVIPLGGDAYMKLRPRTGWGQEKLDSMLQQKGIDPAALSRHEKLLSLHEGKRTTGQGWLPYAQSPFSENESALALGSIPLGIGAAMAAAKYLR